MKEKDLNISEVRGAKKNISDLQVYGEICSLYFAKRVLKNKVG